MSIGRTLSWGENPLHCEGQGEGGSECPVGTSCRHPCRLLILRHTSIFISRPCTGQIKNQLLASQKIAMRKVILKQTLWSYVLGSVQAEQAVPLGGKMLDGSVCWFHTQRNWWCDTGTAFSSPASGPALCRRAGF